MTAVLGIPPPGPVWRCETPTDDLEDLTAAIRVWLAQADPTRRRVMTTPNDDDGRDHTAEEIARAQTEVDEEIRQRQEEWERDRERRERREREIYG